MIAIEITKHGLFTAYLYTNLINNDPYLDSRRFGMGERTN